MSDKFSEDTSTPENELKFSDNKYFPEEIKNKLYEILKDNTVNIQPTKMSSKIKSILDKDFGTGWCVVIGGHFSGAFTFIDNYYIEIYLKELVMVIFKTYKPN